MRKCCKDCRNCEMLMEDELIAVITQYGPFQETRTFIDGVKCMKFGQYAESISELYKSEDLDGEIYRSVMVRE